MDSFATEVTEATEVVCMAHPTKSFSVISVSSVANFFRR